MDKPMDFGVTTIREKPAETLCFLSKSSLHIIQKGSENAIRNLYINM